MYLMGLHCVLCFCGYQPTIGFRMGASLLDWQLSHPVTLSCGSKYLSWWSVVQPWHFPLRLLLSPRGARTWPSFLSGLPSPAIPQCLVLSAAQPADNIIPLLWRLKVGGCSGPSQQEWPLVRCQLAVTSLCSRCHCPRWCCQNNKSAQICEIRRVHCLFSYELRCCFSVVNHDTTFLFLFFLFIYLFFCLAQIDTTRFVLVIRPFVRDIQQNSNGVPVETGANTALLWGEL